MTGAAGAVKADVDPVFGSNTFSFLPRCSVVRLWLAVSSPDYKVAVPLPVSHVFAR